MLWMRYVAWWAIRRWLQNRGIDIVWMLPRNLVYWCAIRVIAYGTTNKYERQIVPELTALEALKRWEKR